MRALCLPILISVLMAATAWGKSQPTQSEAKGAKEYVALQVIAVTPTAQGHAVVLSTADQKTFLLIWIGHTEAISIQMRLDRHRFQRPLTHDLLDAVVRELGGKITKVQIDDLRNNTFVGTLFLEHKGKLKQLDARPSDAIALAVGNRVPILASRKLLLRAGITKEQLMEHKPRPPQSPDHPEAQQEHSL